MVVSCVIGNWAQVVTGSKNATSVATPKARRKQDRDNWLHNMTIPPIKSCDWPLDWTCSLTRYVLLKRSCECFIP